MGRTWFPQLWCLLLTSVISTAVVAQQPSPQLSEKPPEHTLALSDSSSLYELPLEKLINMKVTARKTEEFAADIPVSVTIITEEEIESINADQFGDVSPYVPNLRSGTLRGLSTTSLNVALESGNTYYLDGVHLPRHSTNYPLVDIKQIEVLRGPQGTLFGLNTLSGAITYTSNAPVNRNEADIKVQAGSRNYLNLEGMGNYAINDEWYTRLSFKMLKQDGYYTNLYDGSDLENKNKTYTRLQLRYEPNKKLYVNTSIDYYSQEEDALQGVLRIPPDKTSADTLAAWAATPGQSVNLSTIPFSSLTTNQNDYSKRRLDFWGVNLTTGYQFNEQHALKWIIAYRGEDRDAIRDDEDLLPVAHVSTPFADETDLYSTELNFTGEFNKLNWIAGFYYEQLKTDSQFEIYSSANFSQQFVSVASGITQTGDLDVDYLTDFNATTNALYGSGDYYFTSQLIGTLGLRYTLDERDAHYLQSGGCWTTSGLLQNTCFYPQIDVSDDFSDDAVTGNIALRYLFEENIMAYINIANGSKTGGFNANLTQTGVPASVEVIPGLSYLPTTVTDINFLFAPEKTISYEIGTKLHTPEKKFSFSGALFYLDYEDIVVTQRVEQNFSTNQGEASVKGIELEAGWSPADALALKLRLGYLDGEYDSFIQPDGSDFAGNELSAPDWTGSLQMDHVGDFPEGHLISHLDVTYSSDYYAGADNDDVHGWREEIWALNGRIGIRPRDEAIEFYIWGKNLTDEQFETGNRLSSLGVAQTSFNEPRTIGLELIARF